MSVPNLPSSGSHLSEKTKPSEKVPVVDSLWTFVIAVLVVGPFALPLFWRNPRYSVKTKVWTSIGIIAYTIALAYGTAALSKYLLEFTLAY